VVGPTRILAKTPSMAGPILPGYKLSHEELELKPGQIDFWPKNPVVPFP